MHRFTNQDAPFGGLASSPGPQAASADDPVYHVELGNTYLELGSLDDAAAAYRRAISLDPNLAEAHFNLGNVLSDKEDRIGAIAAYRRAIELKPNFFEAHFNLGETLSYMGLLKEAADCYRRAIELEPNEVAPYNNLGTVLIELGDFEKSINALKRAAELVPESGEIHTNLGTALKHGGRMDEGIEAQRQATEISPHSTEAHFNLGMALAQDGRHEAAEDAYRKAIESDPSLARIYPYMGATLMALGRSDEALALCNDFLAEYPAERSVLAFKLVLLEDMGRMDAARALADYERLIEPVDVQVPEGYADIGAFNAALVGHVLAHPSLVVSPTSHATVKGQHTGNLLVEPKGPFADFEQILWQVAKDYADRHLPNPAHEYLAEWPPLERLVVWSVVMEQEGHQVPHIHPSGWLSGVYYPELPDIVDRETEDREGWIEFGMPPDGFPISGKPRLKLFKPQEGRLFLFPSYFYHRTVPYRTQERRISIAFDYLPAK